MRCEKIKINLKIPFSIDKPDGNGIMYSEEAIINGCKRSKNTPFIAYNYDGNAIPIGVVSDMEYIDGYINVNGMLFHSGTQESVVRDAGVITALEFAGFVFCE